MNLAGRIKDITVPKDNVAIFWLGNAGFVLKSDKDEIIYIDPYLSDCAERLYGFKRIYPSLIKASEVELDCILLSHEHGDHLDVDSIPEIMKEDNIKLIGPSPCIDKCLEIGVDRDNMIQVEEGDEVIFEGFEVRTVFADHGDLAPEAVGYIINFAGIKVYYTGDTAYTPDKMQYAFSLKPDILIPPINGKFNNLDPLEASLVARDCEAKVVIPSHFWTFAEHNGDLAKFVKCVDSVAKETETVLLTQGEAYLYS